MKFINLPSLSLIVADVPERLRGSTRNRIRNACVGSNPAVCALLFFCSSRRGERMDGLRLSVGRFDLWKRRRQKKRKISKKKKKKKHHRHQNPSLISTHITKRGTRTRSLSLSFSLSRKSRSVSFPRFLDARKRVVFPAFFFSRARPHTPHARVVGRLPAQKEQKKRVKSSRRRGHARRVWPTRLERNARNECARTRFFYRWVSKRSRCVGGCRRPSKRRRRKKMMMMMMMTVV